STGARRRRAGPRRTTKHLPDGPTTKRDPNLGIGRASYRGIEIMTETQYGKLTAKVRQSSGKGVARKLRADGLIPAVIYGKGQGNVMLTLSPRELRRAMDPQRKL